MASILRVNLTLENPNHLSRLLYETGDTAHGPVQVATDGYAGEGDVYVVRVRGSRRAILDWLTEEWQDEELALDEFVEAITEGRLTDA